MQCRGIAVHLSFELEAFAFSKNSDAVIAKVAAHENYVAGTGLTGRKRKAFTDAANAGGVDEKAVGTSLLYNFRIAGDDLDARICRGLVHGGDNALQCFQGKTFFQNEGGTQPERNGTTHGEVIDGAVNGERADVSTAKKKRFYYKRIGRDGKPGSVYGYNGLIFQAI